ncbi:trimethylamine methyltransferase family protein [Pacificoceanicola onchidii]|uniref:trimethylamine methyltransferase family protein n=1 Tax=Pacificoceanicola onchidii TaxID=2562685 RepID=UPI0010A45782|nr:trimethylamine methyltransferase family protein [Pacificoceanicola onchidii]
MSASAEAPERRRRGGGRAARVASRAAPLSEDTRPVRPGMKGGQYNPLTEAEVQRIHHAALEALEVVGVSQAPETGQKAMIEAGAILGDDGRLRFPRALVEDMLAKAARGITLHGRSSQFDLQLTDTRVHFGTAGAAVNVVDAVTGEYEPSTIKDLYDSARLAQNLDNIHFFQRTMVACDIRDVTELDVNTAYACLSGTQKHIGTSISDPITVEPVMDLLHVVAGSEEAWRARPFMSMSCCFVVPPMKFATESCEAMEKCIAAGMPVLLLSAGQAGATAPAPIATAIVQAVAECLAGVVYVNAIAPGHPAIFGTWPFVSDLRTGAMSGGSAEQALLSAGCAQMHRFYGIPGGAAGGMTDSKVPDMQAGWEQGIINVLSGLSGLNMVYESVGMYASLMGFSPEGMVLGNDVIGQALRCVRGIDVTEDALSMEVMKSVCLNDGPGHYLGTDQTLSLMQTEYLYPDIGNRMTPKDWNEQGRPALLEAAQARVKGILSEAPSLIAPDLDRAVRERFAIHF